jgi:hypothetical protein
LTSLICLVFLNLQNLFFATRSAQGSTQLQVHQLLFQFYLTSEDSRKFLIAVVAVGLGWFVVAREKEEKKTKGKMASTVWAPVPDSLQEIQEQLPISEVHIDGLVLFPTISFLSHFFQRLF